MLFDTRKRPDIAPCRLAPHPDPLPVSRGEGAQRRRRRQTCPGYAKLSHGRRWPRSGRKRARASQKFRQTGHIRSPHPGAPRRPSPCGRGLRAPFFRGRRPVPARLRPRPSTLRTRRERIAAESATPAESAIVHGAIWGAPPSAPLGVDFGRDFKRFGRCAATPADGLESLNESTPRAASRAAPPASVRTERERIGRESLAARGSRGVHVRCRGPAPAPPQERMGGRVSACGKVRADEGFRPVPGQRRRLSASAPPSASGRRRRIPWPRSPSCRSWCARRCGRARERRNCRPARARPPSAGSRP